MSDDRSLDMKSMLYYLYNRLWGIWFGGLHPSVRLHPLASLQGRRRISIGSMSRICENSRIIADKKGRVDIGDNTEILPFAMLLTYGGYIKIGNYCSVNPFCVPYGHGGLDIGNNVRIATSTIIVPANHVFANVNIPIREQGRTQLGIRIEDDVWIGANATILDGVTIGQGAVVAAGAVVTKDVEAFSVVAGTPARVINYRKLVTDQPAR